MVGDEDELEELANKLLETYTLSEILEMNELDDLDALWYLLRAGLIDTEMPHVI